MNAAKQPSDAPLWISTPDTLEGRLDSEEHGMLAALLEGKLWGESIRFPSDHPIAPTQAIENDWRQFPMLGEVMESRENIARDVSLAREINLDDRLLSRELVHVESLDFTKLKSYEAFTYLKNELHQRRIHMLAQLCAFEIRRRLEHQSRVVYIGFGPGIFPLERALISLLDPQERARTTMLAADVSEDLLRYGLMKNYIDQAHVLDVEKHDDYKQLEPDIVSFCEILEHVKNGAAVFKRTFAPWIHHSNATLIGSVPNHIQPHEFEGLLNHTTIPHQMKTSCFHPLSGHICPWSYGSVVQAMQDWGFSEWSVANTGTRLGRGNNALLNCPDVPGDRFVFWGSKMP